MTPMNGVLWAMMITSQTIGALTVVLPVRRNTFNIVHGAQTGTQSALDTRRLIDPELLIGDEMLVVIASNDVRISIGNGSANQFHDTRLTIFHHFADVSHPLAGLSNLLTFTLFGVQMKERKADIGLGHQHSELRLSLQSLSA